MKNRMWNSAVMMAMATLLAGCGTGAKKQTDKQMNTDSTKAVNCCVDLQKDSLLFTLALDGVKATWIRDNGPEHFMPFSLFPDADNELVKGLSLEKGIPASMSTFLVEANGACILFDTGMGAKDSRLLDGLHSLGIDPTDIKYIYLTHLHGDHIGGMMNNGSVVFPNAEVYVSKTEYDGWMKMAADKKEQVVNTMSAYKNRLHFFAFGDTLPGNVVAMEAVGHTPGHTVYQVGKLLVVGDLIHGAALQLEHPDICAQYDMDKEKAIKARKHILQYVRENGLVMAGMHFPALAFKK